MIVHVDVFVIVDVDVFVIVDVDVFVIVHVDVIVIVYSMACRGRRVTIKTSQVSETCEVWGRVAPDNKRRMDWAGPDEQCRLALLQQP